MFRVTKKDRQTRAVLLMKHGWPYVPLEPTIPGCGTSKKGPAFRRRLYSRSSRCCWCDRELAFADATIEHLVRKSDGGRNTMENCRIACGPCNWSRGGETDPVKVKALGDAYRRRKEVARLVNNYTPPKPVVIPTVIDERYRGLRAEFMRLIGETSCRA